MKPNLTPGRPTRIRRKRVYAQAYVHIILVPGEEYGLRAAFADAGADGGVWRSVPVVVSESSVFSVDSLSTWDILHEAMESTWAVRTVPSGPTFAEIARA